MVEKTDRTAGSGGPRSADGRRFEVFVREEEPDPLRHVGTVAAPTPDAAHEEASELFARYARDVWVCPAEETRRYSAEPLAADDRSPGDEPASRGGDDASRVREETGGTPTGARGGAPVESDAESTVPDDGPTAEGDR